jgi:hypothetical protein
MHHPFCVNAHFRRRSSLRASFMARLPDLASVFAAMAVSHHVEHQTGWGTKRFVATTRRYRTEKFGASRQILAAADPLPDDLCNELAKIGHATVH